MPDDENVLEMDLKPDRARQLLQEIARADDGRVLLVGHLEDMLAQRRITRMQVIRCLKSGRMVEGPYWDQEYDNWKVNMEVMSAGNVIGVVAALDYDNDERRNISIVVTAFYC